ncbi:hypothetical protein F4803DRAFT_435830 [Xylaria telfairii]|nr:hypothetical protein F4803DRAFT_435830 [Xylaria telfairii]
MIVHYEFRSVSTLSYNIPTVCICLDSLSLTVLLSTLATTPLKAHHIYPAMLLTALYTLFALLSTSLFTVIACHLVNYGMRLNTCTAPSVYVSSTP